MIDISLGTILLLILTSFVAGLVDTVAGGGGLLTLPALLSVGITPAQAIATNKLQSIFGTASASVSFTLEKKVAPNQIKLLIFFTFIGATLGTILIQVIETDLLNFIVPLLLILSTIYFALSPQVSDQNSPKKIKETTFACTAALGIGFYDGFFGPGSGSFFTIAFVGLLGFNIIKATASTKVLNFSSNAASVIFFFLGGKIVFWLGIIMSIGQILGSYLGAKLVIKKGVTIVKPFLVLTSLTVTISLLFKNGIIQTIISYFI
jgi:uncharacterized protein